MPLKVWRLLFDRERVRAAAWALRAFSSVHAELREDGLSTKVPAPPPLPSRTLRTVEVVLRIRRATCLERALVVQRWFAARSVPRTVVVGISESPGAFAAHAWVEGHDAPAFFEGYQPIRRVEAVVG